MLILTADEYHLEGYSSLPWRLKQPFLKKDMGRFPFSPLPFLNKAFFSNAIHCFSYLRTVSITKYWVTQNSCPKCCLQRDIVALELKNKFTLAWNDSFWSRQINAPSAYGLGCPFFVLFPYAFISAQSNLYSFSIAIPEIILLVTHILHSVYRRLRIPGLKKVRRDIKQKSNGKFKKLSLNKQR